MGEGTTYPKEGYLKENFRLFHLKDSAGQELDYHYHEFDKIVIFLSGKVNYIVEGVSYNLEPWDIVLVSHHLIHKAVIDRSIPYERVILYLDTGFVEANSSPRESLMTCFKAADKRSFYLMRAGEEDCLPLQSDLQRLEEALQSDEFAADILARTLFLQVMIRINRIMCKDETEKIPSAYEYDPAIAETLSYINDNLSENLNVESLASRCYISKYHFMRKFKEVTGYTVHSYICQKRLIMAVGLIRSGIPATKAAPMSGFQDYSTFIRAFKKMFHTSPGRFV